MSHGHDRDRRYRVARIRPLSGEVVYVGEEHADIAGAFRACGAEADHPTSDAPDLFVVGVVPGGWPDLILPMPLGRSR